MIIYLLGCLAALLLLILGGWLEYKFEDSIRVTVKEAFVSTIFILLSWLGFIFILVIILHVLLDEYGDRTVFKKRKERKE